MHLKNFISFFFSFYCETCFLILKKKNRHMFYFLFTEETCPADQHDDDLLPIIVGSVLAGLILITLVAYLVYRCRLPSEVINLTNPLSHFEDLTNSNYGKLSCFCS
ncbi:unnamed protein product [Enterobius vermicularis]|uniref:PIR Superfamily Protein n=1 Tax=Enterobius vermicularis TaxID=51028 RepID=A0A0N4V506_ENTVE|nr:unnamed protein product [Enterobius vermicularis]